MYKAALLLFTLSLMETQKPNFLVRLVLLSLLLKIFHSTERSLVSQLVKIAMVTTSSIGVLRLVPSSYSDLVYEYKIKTPLQGSFFML